MYQYIRVFCVYWIELTPSSMIHHQRHLSVVDADPDPHVLRLKIMCLRGARNYRPCFRENQPKRSFSIK